MILCRKKLEFTLGVIISLELNSKTREQLELGITTGSIEYLGYVKSKHSNLDSQCNKSNDYSYKSIPVPNV